MTRTQDWSDIFAPDGHILQEGEVIRRTNLSRTLDIIAKEGANGFYQVGYSAYVVTGSGPILSLGSSCGRNREQGSGNRRDYHT